VLVILIYTKCYYASYE